MKEIWKDIKGYEGYYQISNLGRVRSLDRWVNNNGGEKKMKSQIISQRINPSGYLVCKLSKQGKLKEVFVHKIIAESFIENFNKNKTEINHIDHNKLNNSIENLEWCTRLENMNKMWNFYNKKRFEKYCKNENCKKIINYESKYCKKCNGLKNRKTKRPSKEELISMLKRNSFLSLGKKFGVSDNAIRKWCEDYNIPHRKEELKIYLANLED